MKPNFEIGDIKVVIPFTAYEGDKKKFYHVKFWPKDRKIFYTIEQTSQETEIWKTTPDDSRVYSTRPIYSMNWSSETIETIRKFVLNWRYHV